VSRTQEKISYDQISWASQYRRRALPRRAPRLNESGAECRWGAVHAGTVVSTVARFST